MKRYIKASFEITFKPKYKYKSYKYWFDDNIEGYYGRPLTDEEYNWEFNLVKDQFVKQFGESAFNSTPVVEANIGFVPFQFFLIDGDLYCIHIEGDKAEEFEKVDEAWLKQMGCKTPMSEIDRLMSMW